MNASGTDLQAPTTFDAGDGWEGDSGGDALRGDQNPFVPAETPTPPVTPAPVTSDDDQSDPEVPHDDDEALPPAAGEKPPKRTWKERQAEEKRRVAAIKAERETEEVAVRSLREERARYEREAAARQPAPKVEDPPKPVTPELGDEPDWDKYDAEGKSWAEFQKDHTKWLRASVEAKTTAAIKAAADEARKATTEEREKAAAEQREAALETAFEQRMDAARVKHPDLDAVAKTLSFESEFLSTIVFRHEQGAELYYHLASHPEEARALAALPFTQPYLTAVRESDDPIALLSYLVQNRGEFDRITRLAPASALLALGRIVTQSRREDAPLPASSSPAAHVTRSAPPLRQVGGRQSTGGTDDLDEKNPDDWTPEDAKRLLDRSRTRSRR